MGRLVDGAWVTAKEWADGDGIFRREPTTFHRWTRADGSTPFTPEAGRYHLYVSLACPWSHRVVLGRALLGLETALPMTVLDPHMDEDGWTFSGACGTDRDPIFGAHFLREIYLRANAHYSGRVTVPVLWDTRTDTIVNNESRDLLRMLGGELAPLGSGDVELAPPALVPAINKAIEAIYEPINNGVYRAGFATSQSAYEQATREVFEALDRWEDVLGRQRYVVGDRLTEADLCLFPTLFRFDAVYATHFKCNVRRLVDYPNLWAYTRDIYQTAGVAKTCDLDQIKVHYYWSHVSLNPSRIVPVGPALDLDAPHGRG